MASDKYTALWLSHTSISDFLVCPRSYYLKNVYHDPANNHKVKLMSPPLALGQAVHEVLESLSILPQNIRFKDNLVEKFRSSWKKVTGLSGGFTDFASEEKYFQKGEAMISRVVQNPGPLVNQAVKINQDLPKYWLSEDDNIILCGKVDWLEYFPQTDSVHIIDFKTSKRIEKAGSLQLPIYHLLVKNCQKRSVSKASYWYLSLSDQPQEQPLPDPDESSQKILKIAKQVKLARSLQRFVCPYQGCNACLPYEAIIQGNAKHVGIDSYHNDVYILPPQPAAETPDSIIL
ncbi:MAG: PD-(D/E)XK nuclease family protein [Candidatus Shapirobacteria bacterium]|jgi:ATP-dependent helicase/DNAse subunit B